MPAPIYGLASGRHIVKFGNLAIPGQASGVAPYLDLNDASQAFVDIETIKVKVNPKIQTAQIPWRARGLVLSRDIVNKTLGLTLTYREGSPGNLGTFLGQMLEYGTQQLTFDNATQLTCWLDSHTEPTRHTRANPGIYDVPLVFMAADPWTYDMATTSFGPQNCGASSGGTATNFTITYAGTIWAEPQYAFAVPASSNLTQIKLQNTASTDPAITISFASALTAAVTITIDSKLLQVTDGSGTQYDWSGSFPGLYPITGGNTYTATLTCSSGTPTVPLTVTYYNRWAGAAI